MVANSDAAAEGSRGPVSGPDDCVSIGFYILHLPWLGRFPLGRRHSSVLKLV